VTQVNFRCLGFRILTCTFLAFAFAATSAHASTIIDFQGGSGGTVNYGGGGGILSGINIAINTVLGINTPANNSSFAVTSGYLNFQTGSLASYDAGTGTYTFDGGGSFTITGGVSAAGIDATTNGSPTVLLSGGFLGATVGTQNQVKLFIGSGTDTKNPSLVSFFGLPADSLFAFGPATTDVNLTSGAYNGGAFAGTTFSTDVANTVVPEPGSMMLFGSGLVGLSALVRRRRQLNS
jgi:PEP-CTERM motif-containing protein